MRWCVLEGHGSKGTPWVPVLALPCRTLGKRLTPPTSFSFQREIGGRCEDYQCWPLKGFPRPQRLSSPPCTSALLSPQSGKLHILHKLHPQGDQDPSSQTHLPGMSCSAQRALKATFVQPLGPRLQRHLDGVSPARVRPLLFSSPFCAFTARTAVFLDSTGSSFAQKVLRKYFLT